MLLEAIDGMTGRNSMWPRRVGFGFASAGMAIVLLSTLVEVAESALTGSLRVGSVVFWSFLAA